MLKRLVLLCVLIIILIHLVFPSETKKKDKRKVRLGPKDVGFYRTTSCSKFSKNARFNPYSVINEIWFVFYFYALSSYREMYSFTIPSAAQLNILHGLLDGNVTKPVNWTARVVLMRNIKSLTDLLVERNDRGYYWAYGLDEVKTKNDKIEPRDVRLKQYDNGRLLGYLECEESYLYIMSRFNEVPRQNKLQEEAAAFGFRARKGKTYLYQGHHWMPTGEIDENIYWGYDRDTPKPEITKQIVYPDEIEDLLNFGNNIIYQRLFIEQPGEAKENSQYENEFKYQETTSDSKELFHSNEILSEPKFTNDIKKQEDVSDIKKSQSEDEYKKSSSTNKHIKLQTIKDDFEKTIDTKSSLSENEFKIQQPKKTKQITGNQIASVTVTEAVKSKDETHNEIHEQKYDNLNNDIEKDSLVSTSAIGVSYNVSSDNTTTIMSIEDIKDDQTIYNTPIAINNDVDFEHLVLTNTFSSTDTVKDDLSNTNYVKNNLEDPSSAISVEDERNTHPYRK